MANKKFTDLSQASTINETDIVATSQYSGGIWSSLKATILQIANKIVSGINYNSLSTTDKTIIGAINEAAQSGGSGGHTILDDDGTALTQEDNLQFVGVYSEDDSVNDTTKVNIVREMTQAQYDLLSADEKKGIICITDKNYVCEASEVKFGSGNVEAEVEKKMNWVSNGILGAKNLLPYPYYETSHTENGVIFTDNGDGSVTIVTNGASTAAARFNLYGGQGNSNLLPNIFVGMRGSMKYSTGSYNPNVYIYCQPYTADYSAHDNINDTDGTGWIVTNKALIRVAIYVVSGTTLNTPITVYPMLRTPNDNDDTWTPYAMTNKELTDVVNNVPLTAGTYSLQAVRNADGTISYSWV